MSEKDSIKDHKDRYTENAEVSIPVIPSSHIFLLSMSTFSFKIGEGFWYEL